MHPFGIEGVVVNLNLLNTCLFDLLPYVLVNSYGHIGALTPFNQFMGLQYNIRVS